MKKLLLALAVVSIVGCSSKPEDSLIPDEVNDKALGFLYANRHNQASEVSFSNNSLFCIQADRFGEKKDRLAVMAASINDSTVACRIYAYKDGQWKPEGKDQQMHIGKLDKAAFSIRYDDFNFDGHKDVVFNFKKENDGANGYGYLLTYAPHNGLSLHPETFAIPNIKANPVAKEIVSFNRAAPDNVKQKEVTNIYRWQGGKLVFAEEKK